MLDKTADRWLDVLRAIVSGCVKTQEPVGPKPLVERYSLGVSAATIRNDMAVLEEEGLIRQPHTSTGRVPADKGHRFLVDQTDQIKSLSAPERQAITEFFSAAVGFDDVMERTVRLLTHLTRQTVVVEFPTFKQPILCHLELVGMGAEPIRRVLAVAIAPNGRVDQVLVNLSRGTTQSELNNLAWLLENVFTTPETPGGTQSEFTPGVGTVPRKTEETPSHHAPRHEPATPRNPQQQASAQWYDPLSAPETRENVRVLDEAIAATLASGQAESRIVMAGMVNLARFGDFQETLIPLVEALEEQVVLLKLFSQMYEPEPVSVIIGQESGHEVLCDTAIVPSSYDTSGATRVHVEVIGPTRMDYPGLMRVVRAVARYLSGFLRQ